MKNIDVYFKQCITSLYELAVITCKIHFTTPIAAYFCENVFETSIRLKNYSYGHSCTHLLPLFF